MLYPFCPDKIILLIPKSPYPSFSISKYKSVLEFSGEASIVSPFRLKPNILRFERFVLTVKLLPLEVPPKVLSEFICRFSSVYKSN